MATPFIGEVKIISWNFAPQGWAFCNGQLLAINTNQALFSILGTTYGGNGQTTFALPDLRSRVPIYQGQGFTIGERGGEENHTLTTQEMASHIHMAMGTTDAADSAVPATRVLAKSAPDAFKLYSANSGSLVPLRQGSIGLTGGTQPHPNIQPYLALNFIIALQGIFPSRN